MKHKVILDTDPGVDDAMAIAFCIAHPDIDLLALSIVFGNGPVERCAANARFLLEQFGAPEVDVVIGAEGPTVKPQPNYAEGVHGDDALGNIYPAGYQSSLPTHALDAADYIIERTREAPGEITLVAVGPLANIANALQRDPSLPERVRELIVMGGTVSEPGNVTPLAEANFYNDPHAADRVCSADWPLTVVGLDVTHKVMLGDGDLARLRDKAGVTGRLLWDSSRFYVDFYSNRGAASGTDEPACAVHDATAIACLLSPSSFERCSGPARVVESGLAEGQLALDRRGYDYFSHQWRGRPGIQACMDVDSAAMRELFLETIERHHRR